jgi:hypothetical protein
MELPYVFHMYNGINIYKINDGLNPTFLWASKAPLHKEVEMAFSTHPEPVRIPDTEALSPMAFNSSVRAAGRAVRRFAHAFSESCRRIRAYNELANLSPDAFRQPERRRQVIEKIINGRQRAAGSANPPQHRSIRP